MPPAYNSVYFGSDRALGGITGQSRWSSFADKIHLGERKTLISNPRSTGRRGSTARDGNRLGEGELRTINQVLVEPAEEINQDPMAVKAGRTDLGRRAQKSRKAIA